MNLQPRKESIVVQDEFLLNTQGLIFKVGGITLSGTAFGADGSIVKAGTAVVKDDATGLFVPYADVTGAVPAGAEVYLTAHDVVIKGQANAVTGAVIRAYVNTSKLTGVTTALRTFLEDRGVIFG